MTTAGDQDDPRHGDWLAALGRATDQAARLATTCFDLARVLGGVSSDAMYSDPLGGLQRRVRAVAAGPAAPPAELTAFLAVLSPARETRNDLLHALRVRGGLYRRVAHPYRVREFFTVESIDAAGAEMERAGRLGADALHADGGAAVAAWYAAGGS